jgi:hypothetical protein
MVTIRKIITTSLRNLGVTSSNAVPTAEDIEISMQAFNALIDSLSNNVLNIHTVNPYRFEMQAGKSEYTLGPEVDDAGNPTDADWVIPRPMRIEQAVLMVYATGPEPNIGANSGTLFLSLELLNYSQYASITVRKLETNWPTSVYDNGGYPVRKLTFWPVPQQTLACELWLWQPLATYDTLDENLDLPPGYERYLMLKLAKEVSPEFGAVWTNTLEIRMKEAENEVKTLNQQIAFVQPSALGRGVTNRSPAYVQNDGKYSRIPRVW